MFEFIKSPLSKIVKQNSADAPSSNNNPFDTSPDSTSKQTLNSTRRTSSEPVIVTPNVKTNPFDEGKGGARASSSSSYSVTSTARSKYKNDFRESGGLENQSVQELESYAVYKAEETTKSVHGCLKIAEDIREEASKTLVTLHQQGEQITRTHMAAADIDRDLSRGYAQMKKDNLLKGEKLLGSLGGMFSKTWKPKKTHTITGPTNSRDYLHKRKENQSDERERLGLTSTTRGQLRPPQSSSEPTTTLQRVEVEKEKQDDAFNDLSNILGELKVMALDMGCEIDSQVKTLEPFHNDVDELNSRMKGANKRGQRLLGK
ncbi:hypothetical protein GIB67_000756 [Kingdonia uniflora]|uniref:t-SNARE coiled-coil homology domain-containing protein n=1 Tax=Kingdonia uniflora TaxID=39325 RepID=A0A7J7NDW9_9MAGN|nr:hypothetical protein GIB67_000756 [Kingdonia uniflora]